PGDEGPELPPQAPEPTPTLADTQVQTAPPAVQALRQANFGDAGADRYQAMVDAGRAAGGGGLSQTPGLPPTTAPPPPAPQAPSPIFLTPPWTGSADPAAWSHIQNARSEQQARYLQTQLAQSKDYRDKFNDLFDHVWPSLEKMFVGRPDLAAAQFSAYAAEQG